MPTHVHAELMAQYAKDAAETEAPWVYWQFFDDAYGTWEDFVSSHPAWNPSTQYRRRPTPMEIWVNVYDGGLSAHYSESSAKASLAGDGRTVHFREVLEDK